MRTRPNALIAIAAALLVVGLSLPLQVMIYYGHAPWEIVPVLAKLAPLNWAILAGCLISAYSLWNASPWSWLTTAMLLSVVAWNNWLIWSLDVNYSDVTLLLSMLGMVALHGVLFTPTAFKVLRNPSLRWWRTPKRYSVPVRTLVRPVVGGELIAHTFNISEGGAFITTEGVSWVQPLGTTRRRIKAGIYCSVILDLGNGDSIRCRAEIVRETRGDVSHPCGFAIRFIGLDRGTRSTLMSYVKERQSDQDTGASISQAA